MDKKLTPRHVRHRKRKRLRRSKDFKAFLTGLQATLNATGATVTPFTTTVVQASGVLTGSALANGDTFTINGRTYTMQTTLTNVNNNVKSTGVLATDLANLAKAINLTGVAGTDYAAAQTINADVSAVAAATTLTVTAKLGGTAGNAFATTKTGTAGNTWASGTLTGGVAQTANLTKATHGKIIGEGPFLASNAGGSLPTPLDTTTLYWVVAVPDANNFGLASSKRGAALTLTAPGSGTNTLTKASSLEAIFQYLKKRGGKQMRAATDVDFL
jgi:hypothetical protein